MSVVFDAASSHKVDGTSLSGTHSVTTGASDRIFIAMIGFNPPRTPSTVTYGGNTMTNIGTVTDPEQGRVELEAWYLVSPPTGANTFEVTVPSSTRIAVVLSSYTGVDQNNPLGTEVTASPGAVTSINVDVISASGEMVVDGIASENGDGWVAGAGQVEMGDLEQPGSVDAENVETASSREGGAGSVNMAWSQASGFSRRTVQLAVPLRQASAGRARLIQYLHNAFASAEMGRTVITDAESGDDISIAQLDADNWIRTDGPYLPTTFRYADLVEDPAVSYLESVSSDGRIEAVQESALESLFRRLGGRSV